jgi:hypothetical protein
MCPVCIATVALIAGSAASTGGLTALVFKKSGARNNAHEIPIQSEAKEDRNGQQHDRS